MEKKRIPNLNSQIYIGDTIYHGVLKEGILHLMPRHDMKQSITNSDVQGSHAKALILGLDLINDEFVDYMIGLPLASDDEAYVRLIGHTIRSAQGQRPIGLALMLVSMPSVKAVAANARDIQVINDALNIWLETHKGCPIKINAGAFVNNDPLAPIDEADRDTLLSMLGFKKEASGFYSRTQIVHLVQSIYSITPAVYTKLKQLAETQFRDPKTPISDVVEWLIAKYQQSQVEEKRRILPTHISF